MRFAPTADAARQVVTRAYRRWGLTVRQRMQMTAAGIPGQVRRQPRFLQRPRTGGQLGVGAALGIDRGQLKLLGIRKRGNNYLCMLLVYSVRSVLRATQRVPDDPANRWRLRLRERRHQGAAAALANHTARRAGALLALGEDRRPTGVLAA